MIRSEQEEHRDRLIDGLLVEVVGGQKPPDLTDRILARAAARSDTKAGLRAFRPSAGGIRGLWVWVSVAAFLALLAAGWWWQAAAPSGGGQVHLPARKSDSAAVANGRDLSRGTWITAGKETRSLELGGYCRLELASLGRMRIDGEGTAQRIFLEQGQVSCEVDRTVGTFEVLTGLGLVAVKGTRFSVQVPDNQGGRQMDAQQMVVRVTAGLVLLSALGHQAELAAGEEGGVFSGILVRKDDKGLWVQGDEGGEPRRFLPRWIGGAPKDGGGLDPAMLAKFKGLFTGNRVKVVWKMEEHERVLEVEMLVPEKKAGTVEGVVLAKGEGWLELLVEGVRERFSVRWIGGNPADGGGPDRPMLERLKAVAVGNRVWIRWEYEERRRLVEIKVLDGAAKEDEKGAGDARRPAPEEGARKDGDRRRERERRRDGAQEYPRPAEGKGREGPGDRPERGKGEEF